MVVMKHRDPGAGRMARAVRLSRRHFLGLLGGAVAQATALGRALAAPAGGKPNFVVILTDDQGYADLGCFGSTTLKTPHVDRMAAEGLKCTSFYSQPVCGPARAALMTGCYPQRVGQPGNKRHAHTALHPKEVTIAEVLKGAGYATACLGKWHLGDSPEQMPRKQGFDYFYGTPKFNGATRYVNQSPFVCQLIRNEAVIESPANQATLTKRYTEEAIQFLTANKDRPFFLYFCHNMPHVPLAASEDFRGKSPRGLYGDAVEEIDWSVGRVLDTLKALGLEENTLVLFTSDNGPWLAPPIAEDGGSAAPLRGAKMTTWEGGFRVPAIFRWPGKVPAGRTCDEILTTLDLMPTLAQLAGTAAPADRVIDGKDIAPVLFGRPGAKSPHEAFFYYADRSLQAVRSGKWKLALTRPDNPDGVIGWYAIHTQPLEKPQLFDLEADIGETRDVAADHPDVVAALTVLADRCREDLGDGLKIGKGERFWDTGDPADERRPIAKPGPNAQVVDGGGPYPHDFSYAEAIGPERGVSRRDPGDVLRVGDTFYVWYTKIRDEAGVFQYPSGYSGTVWYATSPDGRRWTERGEAVGKGGAGAWDEHGVFTPNILEADGRYYLFYTGVPKPFSAGTPTAIGVAEAESPDGPWKKTQANPVLRPSDDPALFDSFRVDDACLLVRDSRYWMYFKGRQQGHSPGETKMGVAMAGKPAGPYVKWKANPVIASGHEVLCWPHGWGVASMVTAAGPQKNTIQFALDGVQFAPRGGFVNGPHAPGAYRPEAFRNHAFGQVIKWGIDHSAAGKDLFLRRFDCLWAAGGGDAAGPRPARGKAKG
ncbi:MAG: sulfatase-like hydrolase/transferase [Planctomycetes bacterium]|nr:sulfatase-like hydrolase/transferase [Planctomycetota bacterium]